MPVHVIAIETRPLNRGSRITAAELLVRDVETTRIPDDASGLCMQDGRGDVVIVGADRIVLDGGDRFGDQGVVLNELDTYKQAVLADWHGVPFVVAAPRATIHGGSSADEVTIEERDAAELSEIYGHENAPPDVDVYNPAFDATRMELVAYLVTEDGVFEPPLDWDAVLGQGDRRIEP